MSWICDNVTNMIGLGALFFFLSYLVFAQWLKKSPDEVEHDIETADTGFIFKGRPLLAKVAGFLNYWGIIPLIVGGLSWLLCLLI